MTRPPPTTPAPPSEMFHLCCTGWELYDAWTFHLETKSDIDTVTRAHEAYVQHRRTCPKCTPWKDKAKVSDNEH